MGTVILDLNIAQELASVYQEPLYLVFLDLQKAYDDLDRGHLLANLEGYDVGPYMCKLLEVFWEQQEVTTCQNGYHVRHFRATRETTQGGIISSILFNLNVDNVVSNWFALTVEDQIVAQKGIGLAVGRCLGLFYADNVMLGWQDPEWLQGAMIMCIGLFCRYGLLENVVKYKSMTCHPGTL